MVIRVIPKKIHYCWFGRKELPPLAKKCIQSWKKFFPDYEIIEWNEENFNIELNRYVKEAYNEGKYAFVTDVARLYIIYNFGGIYFDTDVEVIKPFDELLKNDAFFGLEREGYVATGLGFGATERNKLVKSLLDDYNNRNFINDDKTYNLVSCPIINSKIFRKYGFTLNGNYEKIKGVAVYPSDYLNPKGGYEKELLITNNTVSIHHFDGSWLSDEQKKRAQLLSKINKKFGTKLGKIIFNTVCLPYRIVSKIKEGMRSGLNEK